MYHLIMNAVMLAVLVTHLVHLVHLPLIPAQPALIMNVDKLVKIAPTAVRVVILQPTPAVVMTPQRQNVALHVIGLRSVVLIAVLPGQNIIPVLMPVLPNVALVVTTVLTAVLRALHPIPAHIQEGQNVDLVAILAQIVALQVRPHRLVQVVTMLKVSVQQNVALLAILV